jgi:hypothetical protein
MLGVGVAEFGEDFIDIVGQLEKCAEGVACVGVESRHCFASIGLVKLTSSELTQNYQDL